MNRVHTLFALFGSCFCAAVVSIGCSKKPTPNDAMYRSGPMTIVVDQLGMGTAFHISVNAAGNAEVRKGAVTEVVSLDADSLSRIRRSLQSTDFFRLPPGSDNACLMRLQSRLL